MSAPRPGNQERGWNDPPLFDYQGSSALQASPRRNVLNKRVAYPAMSGPQSQGEKDQSDAGTGTLLNPACGPPKSDITILPPTSSAETPSLVPLIVPSLGPPSPTSQSAAPQLTTTSKTGDVPLSTNLEEVFERLQVKDEDQLLECVVSALNEGLEKIKDKLTTRAAEDVRRKIVMLSEHWKDKKLSVPVRCRMGNISQALKNDKYQEAWNIHQTLIVDYTSEVNLWLVGVKRIIHELLEDSKRKGEISDTDNTCANENLLLTATNEIEQLTTNQTSDNNVLTNQDTGASDIGLNSNETKEESIELEKDKVNTETQ